jgi:hypothetical protein
VTMMKPTSANPVRSGEDDSLMMTGDCSNNIAYTAQVRPRQHRHNDDSRPGTDSVSIIPEGGVHIHDAEVKPLSLLVPVPFYQRMDSWTNN